MIMDGLGVMFSKLRGSHVSKLPVKDQVSKNLRKGLFELDWIGLFFF